jgi:hypothetical protein
LAFLEVASSPAFVRAPEGNGRAERFIRTLNGLEPRSGSRPWLRTFDTVEELRQAVLAFKERCNRTWIVEHLGYRTSAQVRTEQLPPATLAA